MSFADLLGMKTQVALNRYLVLAVALFIGSCLTCGLSRAQAHVTDDNDPTETGFADRNGHSAMSQAVERLAHQVRLLPDSAFPTLPSDWTKEQIAKTIEAVQSEPAKRKLRKGHLLLLDHDMKRQTITALEPFFTIYGLLPDGKDLTREQYKDIEGKLLREVSRLWKSNDLQADKFANEMLSLFDRDMIFCKGEFHFTSTIPFRFIINRAWQEGGILVTPANWAVSAETPSYKDMVSRGINSDLFKTVISSGVGQNPVVRIERVSSPQESLKIIFKMTRVEYETGNGKGQFFDVDGQSHPLVCQNTL